MDDNSPKYGHFIGHLTHHVGIPNLGRRPRALNNYDRPLQKTRLTFFAPRNTQIWKNVRKHIPEKNNRISILVQVIFAPISAWKDDIPKRAISPNIQYLRKRAHWRALAPLWVPSWAVEYLEVVRTAWTLESNWVWLKISLDFPFYFGSLCTNMAKCEMTSGNCPIFWAISKSEICQLIIRGFSRCHGRLGLTHIFELEWVFRQRKPHASSSAAFARGFRILSKDVGMSIDWTLKFPYWIVFGSTMHRFEDIIFGHTHIHVHPTFMRLWAWDTHPRDSCHIGYNEPELTISDYIYWGWFETTPTSWFWPKKSYRPLSPFFAWSYCTISLAILDLWGNLWLQQERSEFEHLCISLRRGGGASWLRKNLSSWGWKTLSFASRNEKRSCT